MSRPYQLIFNLLALSIVIYIGVDTFYRVVRSKLTQVHIKTSIE